MRIAPIFVFLASLALAQENEYVLPDLDASRTERLVVLEGRRIVAPEGFVVEEAASDALVGSIVNMTFDHKGRPALSKERGGIVLLSDSDGDGVFDAVKVFSDEIDTAHGMHYIGPGDLLVNANGPQGAGLYRLTDLDGDDRSDRTVLIAKSRGGIQEHGPHTILTGFDGYLYVLYGNHAHPDVELDPGSPLGRPREDHLLPRYLDPRGHANRIRAPGGTIHRLDLESNTWTRIVGGFRNPFDMAVNAEGELFTYDSDMEWDRGQPWFRPTRAIHAIPGGDYGWRTGSSKFPFYYIDTLPGVDNIGRGSPVGVAFYRHNVYPEKFRGAFFMGDWSRGRIRVMFPERRGATYDGRSHDFILGEPLNVTDLDIGPDGHLYFSMGGRMTSGGLYRVRYTGAARASEPATEIQKVLRQPMPRSAWGRQAITEAKDDLGERWAAALRSVSVDANAPSDDRLRAIETLQVYGPKPLLVELSALLNDKDATVRAAAVLLLGALDYERVAAQLARALGDSDPFVARRACEALIRSGMSEADAAADDTIGTRLIALLNHEDRYLRYAARLAAMRLGNSRLRAAVSRADIERSSRGALESLLALVLTQSGREDADLISKTVLAYSFAPMDEPELLDYLRVLSLALIRDESSGGALRGQIQSVIGPRLLEKLPTGNWQIDRELQVVLASLRTPGSIEKMLKLLAGDRSQQEQIHTAYCLRTIDEGWSPEQRTAFVAWFDRGRKMTGAASMEGYIENIWKSLMEFLPDDERAIALARKDQLFKEERDRAVALLAESPDEGTDRGRSELAQMSFEELSEYLEYDVMTYERGSAERGERVFRRLKCIDCHVFGSIGRGGGPDLSTVVSRMRRGDILESIAYPSRVISDQYTGLVLDLKNRETVTGMLAGEGPDSLTLITPTGERVEVARNDIAERRASEISIMPEGLLGAMSLSDLVGLMLFLERDSEL